MTQARSLLLLPISLTILLVGFATPAQSPRKIAAKLTRVNIRKIDTEGLKQLIKRDPANTRPLLINFWATWCDPCRDEFPELVKIDRDYRRKGLDFIAVSLDDPQELKTGVPKFLREMRATMPAYLLNVDDPEPAITFVDPAWSGALPATVLYNAEGELVFKHVGRIKDAELRAAIDKVVGNKGSDE